MFWNELTIRQFSEIADIIKEGDQDELQLQIKILSVCTGKSPEEYREMPVQELKAELEALNELNSREPVEVKNKYIIDGKPYMLTIDFENMKTGQYIDYVNTLNSEPDNRALIMAILLVPKGCKYGEGYKITDLAQILNEHMRWCDVEAICFFFRVYLAAYTKVKLTSLNRRLKKEKKKEKDPERIEILTQSIQKMEDLIAGIK